MTMMTKEIAVAVMFYTMALFLVVGITLVERVIHEKCPFSKWLVSFGSFTAG